MKLWRWMRAAQHRHRVGVVEQNGLRAVFFHVADNVHHRVDRAQEAEDARRAARVADVGVHAVLLGDFDVVPPDVGGAGQDGRQHHVGASQRLGPIQRRGDFGGIVAQGDDLFDRAPRKVQAFRVNVHQRDLGVRQQRERQHVAHERAGEAQTAGSDECNLGHGVLRDEILPRRHGVHGGFLAGFSLCSLCLRGFNLVQESRSAAAERHLDRAIVDGERVKRIAEQITSLR